mgnify:FL=1
MKNKKYLIEGACNVATNISNIGSKTKLICLSGNDSSSVTISKLLSEHKLIKNLSIEVPNFKTLIKTRFINNAEHLLRVDNVNINFKLIKNKRY